MKRIIFVCNSCQHRAPSMRDLVNKDFGKMLFCIARGVRPYYEHDAIQPDEVETSDLVVAMTAHEALQVLDKYPDLHKNGKLMILGLGDDYEYMNQHIKTTYSLFYKEMFGNMFKHAISQEVAQWGGEQ